MSRVFSCLIFVCLQALVANAQEVYSYVIEKDIKDKVNINDSAWVEMPVGTRTVSCALEYNAADCAYNLIMNCTTTYNEYVEYTYMPETYDSRERSYTYFFSFDSKETVLAFFDHCRKASPRVYEYKCTTKDLRSRIVDENYGHSDVTWKLYKLMPPKNDYPYFYYDYTGCFMVPKSECQHFYNALLSFSEMAEQDSVLSDKQSVDSDTLLSMEYDTISKTGSDNSISIEPHYIGISVIVLVTLFLIIIGFIYFKRKHGEEG